MKMRHVVLSLVLFALLGCARNPVTGRLNLMFISEGDELAIGQNAAPEVERQFGGEYSDHDLQRYVEDVGLKLVKVCPRNEIEYHFTVLNSPVVNAFALPGGYVYVTRGIMVRMKNEAMLAAVLGHEITHVAARHGAQHLSNAIAFEVLLTAGVMYTSTRDDKHAREKAVAVYAAGTVLNGLIMLGYGRDDEYEADFYGVDFMVKAGYHPRGMVQVLQMLKDLEKKDSSAVQEFFSSHPMTSKRIDEVEKEIHDRYPDMDEKNLVFNEDRFTDRTRSFTARQRAVGKYDQARRERKAKHYPASLKLLDEAVTEDPKQASYYVERGDVRVLQKDYTRAEDDYRQALAVDPDDYNALVGYGRERYRQKDFRTAEENFVKATRRIPSHYLAHFHLAETYDAMKKRDKARAEYELVVKLTSENSDAAEVAEKSKKRLREFK